MHKEVIWDVETKKLFSDVEREDPALLGVSIVSLYERTIDENYVEKEGKVMSFWEKDFDRMWPIFQNADRLIGFNSINFDVPALQPYANFPLSKLPHFDILAELKRTFGKRISLDRIAKETLDKEKIDTGLNAVFYWEKGDADSLAKLQKYCEADVIITKEVYDHVINKGFLLFKDHWNTLRQVDMDFKYQEEAESEKQIGLF